MIDLHFGCLASLWQQKLGSKPDIFKAVKAKSSLFLTSNFSNPAPDIFPSNLLQYKCIYLASLFNLKVFQLPLQGAVDRPSYFPSTMLLDHRIDCSFSALLRYLKLQTKYFKRISYENIFYLFIITSKRSF